MDIQTSVSVALVITLTEGEAQAFVQDPALLQRQVRVKLRSMDGWAVGPAPAQVSGRVKALPAPKARSAPPRGPDWKQRKPIDRATCPTCDRVVAAFTLTNGTHVCGARRRAAVPAVVSATS